MSWPFVERFSVAIWRGFPVAGENEVWVGGMMKDMEDVRWTLIKKMNSPITSIFVYLTTASSKEDSWPTGECDGRYEEKRTAPEQIQDHTIMQSKILTKVYSPQVVLITWMITWQPEPQWLQ